MCNSQSFVSEPSIPSVEQIADMLAVVIWADHLMADEVYGIRFVRQATVASGR